MKQNSEIWIAEHFGQFECEIEIIMMLKSVSM